ncbi:MAG: hypothetical protein QG622_1526 [Actinomycetota bacterium]|nr:hypothetical protein [Actinomycetota bacterium]
MSEEREIVDPRPDLVESFDTGYLLLRPLPVPLLLISLEIIDEISGREHLLKLFLQCLQTTGYHPVNDVLRFHGGEVVFRVNAHHSTSDQSVQDDVESFISDDRKVCHQVRRASLRVSQ